MSLEAEQSILGALLNDASAIGRIASLKAEHFSQGEHRAIFAAMLTDSAKGRPFDAVTLADSGASSLDYLNGLYACVPSASNIERHAKIVREAAAHRALRERAMQAVEIASGEGKSREKLDAISTLFSGMEREQGKAPKRLGELAMQRLDEWDAIARGEKEPGWPTSIPSLDTMHNGGLRPGKLYILAARPSVGKSSFVMHLLMALARQGKHGLFLSQEMESEEVVGRAVCNDARINAGSLASGRMSDDEWARAAESMEALAGLPVWVDDTPALSLLDIRGKARLIPSLRVLVLDYIQLCAPTDSKRTRTEQVGEISRGLKALSKQLGIAVIALSQLNRDVEKRAGKRPQMSDLRDSGEIEQDADGIWFLWPLREETHTDLTRRVGLDVAKNRGGQKGAFVLRFDGARQHWAESMERVDDFTKKQAGGEL
jgi:replicative DNA helicase